jgi:hypothetical protein
MVRGKLVSSLPSQIGGHSVPLAVDVRRANDVIRRVLVRKVQYACEAFSGPLADFWRLVSAYWEDRGGESDGNISCDLETHWRPRLAPSNICPEYCSMLHALS